MSSTGPCHSWIKEKMKRVEDYCNTCTTEYQKTYKNVQEKMKIIIKMKNIIVIKKNLKQQK